MLLPRRSFGMCILSCRPLNGSRRHSSEKYMFFAVIPGSKRILKQKGENAENLGVISLNTVH